MGKGLLYTIIGTFEIKVFDTETKRSQIYICKVKDFGGTFNISLPIDTIYTKGAGPSVSFECFRFFHYNGILYGLDERSFYGAAKIYSFKLDFIKNLILNFNFEFQDINSHFKNSLSGVALWS